MRLGLESGDKGQLGKGLFWSMLDVIPGAGWLGRGLKGGKAVTTAAKGSKAVKPGMLAGAGKWVGNTAKGIGSSVKNFFSKGYNKLKNWWRGGKKAPKTKPKPTPKQPGAPKSPKQPVAPKSPKQPKQPAQPGWGRRIGQEALGAGIQAAIYRAMYGGGQQSGAVPQVAQAGPAPQGLIAAGPTTGSTMGGANAGFGGFNLGDRATSPVSSDSRYSGFLNKFKFGQGRGSFFK
jgi:hypothetical protein